MYAYVHMYVIWSKYYITLMHMNIRYTNLNLNISLLSLKGLKELIFQTDCYVLQSSFYLPQKGL